MNITGTFCSGQWHDSINFYPTGAFYRTNFSVAAADGKAQRNINGFSAANSWTGKTSSNGDHSHTITSTLAKSPIYGNNETVQPPSVSLKVKTRYK